MSKSILIVGADGFIGRHLSTRLLVDGHKVNVITRRTPNVVPLSISWCVDEAPSLDTWRSLLRTVDAVVYLASVSTPAGSAGRPVAEAASLTHLLTLLEAMQMQPNTPLIYLSSAGSLYAPADGRASDESDAIGPRSYHGASKAAAEAFIGAWCAQFGGSSTVLRPSNVYGPGQMTRPGFGVIPTAFWHMRHAEPMDVWGDGSQTRDYIHVNDLVDLCVTAATARTHSAMSVYNAASGQSTSLNDLFGLMENIAGLPLTRVTHQPRPVDAIHVAIDPHKAQQHFQWKARTTLRDGLEETWRWYRSTGA